MDAEGCRDQCLGEGTTGFYMGPTYYEAPCKAWTIIDRLWFCTVLLTTVGYGNSFVPNSPLSRQFTLLWALYGLLVFGATSSAWLNAYQSLAAAVKTASARAPPPEPDPPRHQPPDPPRHQPPDLYHVARGFFVAFLYFVGLSFVGAAIFSATETDWLFVDAYLGRVKGAVLVGPRPATTGSAGCI